jgi:hypothetical protein
MISSLPVVKRTCVKPTTRLHNAEVKRGSAILSLYHVPSCRGQYTSLASDLLEPKTVNGSTDWVVVFLSTYKQLSVLYLTVGYNGSLPNMFRFFIHYSYKVTNRFHLENLTGLQLVKKFPAFYGTRRFITVFTSARNLSLT